MVVQKGSIVEDVQDRLFPILNEPQVVNQVRRPSNGDIGDTFYISSVEDLFEFYHVSQDALVLEVRRDTLLERAFPPQEWCLSSDSSLHSSNMHHEPEPHSQVDSIAKRLFITFLRSTNLQGEL